MANFFAGNNKNSQALALVFGAVVITTLSPFPALDAVILGSTLLVLGHLYLQEKLLLVFLCVRPLVDVWRDTELAPGINVNAAMAILFAVWGSYMLYRHWHSAQETPLRLPLFLFIVVSAVSILYSVSPSATFVESVKMYVLGLFFALSYIFVKKRLISWHTVAAAISFSAIFPVVVGLVQLAFGLGWQDPDLNGSLRIFGTFAHPNVLALFTLFVFLIHTEVACVHPSDFWLTRPKAAYALAALIFITMIFTYTRVALVGLAAFFVIIGLFHYRKFLAYAGLAAAVFYLSFYPVNAYLKEQYQINLQQVGIIRRLTERNTESDSIAWRVGVLQDSLAIIRNRPLLGYGFGTFPAVWNVEQPPKYVHEGETEAHNDYLRLLLEVGVLGIIPYLYFLAALLWHVWNLFKKSLRQEHLFLFGMIAMFILMSVSDNMLHHTAVAWIVFTWWGIQLARAEALGLERNFLKK